MSAIPIAMYIARHHRSKIIFNRGLLFSLRSIIVPSVADFDRRLQAALKKAARLSA
ncbi:MAG: hypothetical protein LBV36_02890 [Chromatiales bacterium]|jgi:hypothetical protein|nr:hypothetical protein [Chromatiales bacterium]